MAPSAADNTTDLWADDHIERTVALGKTVDPQYDSFRIDLNKAGLTGVLEVLHASVGSAWVHERSRGGKLDKAETMEDGSALW